MYNVYKINVRSRSAGKSLTVVLNKGTIYREVCSQSVTRARHKTRPFTHCLHVLPSCQKGMPLHCVQYTCRQRLQAKGFVFFLNTCLQRVKKEVLQH